MSDFLIIAPDDIDWIQMNQDEVNRMTGYVSAQDIISFSDSGDLGNLTPLLKDYGFLPDDQYLSAVRILPTGNAAYPYQFWYKV
jgi:hypothetical protein